MNDEKSCDLLSASWRPREAGGAIQIQAQRSEDQGCQWYKCKSEGWTTKSANADRRRKWLSWLKQRAESTLPLPFHSTQALTDWMGPTGAGEDALCSAYWFECWSPGNTLTDILRNNVLPAIWALSVQWSWHTKLAVTRWNNQSSRRRCSITT